MYIQITRTVSYGPFSSYTALQKFSASNPPKKSMSWVEDLGGSTLARGTLYFTHAMSNHNGSNWTLVDYYSGTVQMSS